ncbi:MAG: MASE1 domain-containing protein, partial [Flammeovirgaceae bacterium]|nr:MASE1 domain-containing protein [Flammeovirgaceae bacterium]
MHGEDKPKAQVLPWWTWLAPLVLIVVGDQISLLFKYHDSFSAFYLPTSIGIVLIHWWGPWRVAPWVFVLTSLNNWYYGIDKVWLWPGFGLVEGGAVFVSWLLFARVFKGKVWMPDIKNAGLFLLFGVVIPMLIEVVGWEVLYIVDGTFPKSMFWESFNRDILNELIVNFVFTLPILFFFTPKMNSWRLLSHQFSIPKLSLLPPRKVWMELVVLLAVITLLTYFLPFNKFWFIYGL